MKKNQIRNNIQKHIRPRIHKKISNEQALIMALRMHSRGDCSLPRALLTGLELRYQINFLDELNVSRQEFEWLIGRERDILSDWK